MDDSNLIALDEGLAELATIDAEAAELVQLRYFAGTDNSSSGRNTGHFAAHGRPHLGLCSGLAVPQTFWRKVGVIEAPIPPIN
jgi:hypothetical protein